MNTEPIIESGLQVITRLIDRPSLQELDSDLFFKGLDNTDFVEIKGTISSGVNGLLNKLIARCILPLKYNGLNADVLYVNTENQFQSTRLYDIMRAEITDIQGPVNVDGLVKNLMDNLKVINCYNHQQLFLTLSSLDNILLKNKKVAFIIVDSISAYYWQRKEGSYNSYLLKLLSVIKKVTGDFKVVTVYTKQFDFETKNKNIDSWEGKKILRYEVSLIKNEKAVCNVKSGSDVKQLDYEINNGNFKW